MANTKDKQKTKREISDQVSEYNKNYVRKQRLGESKINNIELTPKQQELYKMIRNNTLTVCQGPAGTSKTFTACYTSIKLLVDKKIDKIILTKPIQESGENLGFLPGTKEEKIDPYMKSYYTNFEKIIGQDEFNWLVTMGFIVVEPLAYMRGTTYDRSIMLLDEAQNCTMTQLMLWVTRLGEDSRAVMMGDVSQYDIKKQQSKFLEFIKIVENVPQLALFKFDTSDIVRNKFLIDIVNVYEKWKSEGNM